MKNNIELEKILLYSQKCLNNWIVEIEKTKYQRYSAHST